MTDKEVQQGAGGTELAGQAAGVAGDPAGTGVAPEAASSQAPAGQTATAAQAGTTTAAPGTGPQATPDWNEDPKFQEWQRKRDRKERELQRQVAQQQIQLAQLQTTAEQARMATASPEEQAQYYLQQTEALRQEQQAQAGQMQERQVIMGKAQEYLQDLGIAPDAPGLVWPEQVDYAGLAELMASAAKLANVRNQAATQQTQTQVDEAAHAARIGALKDAGVTQANLATGSAQATDLLAQFQAEKAAFRGSGDTVGFLDMKRRYREQGLDV